MDLEQQLRDMIEIAIESTDWEPGDAQRALQKLRAAYWDLPDPAPGLDAAVQRRLASSARVTLRNDVRATHEPS